MSAYFDSDQKSIKWVLSFSSLPFSFFPGFSSRVRRAPEEGKKKKKDKKKNKEPKDPNATKKPKTDRKGKKKGKKITTTLPPTTTPPPTTTGEGRTERGPKFLLEELRREWKSLTLCPSAASRDPHWTPHWTWGGHGLPLSWCWWVTHTLHSIIQILFGPTCDFEKETGTPSKYSTGLVQLIPTLIRQSINNLEWNSAHL